MTNLIRSQLFMRDFQNGRQKMSCPIRANWRGWGIHYPPLLPKIVNILYFKKRIIRNIKYQSKNYKSNTPSSLKIKVTCKLDMLNFTWQMGIFVFILQTQVFSIFSTRLFFSLFLLFKEFELFSA